MDKALVEAFETICEALYQRIPDTDVALLDESLEELARELLTEDEFIEYTEGYDKDGNAVIGR